MMTLNKECRGWLCACGALAGLLMLSGCSSTDSGVTISDERFTAAIMTELGKAETCAEGRAMGLRSVHWEIMPGDPAHGYRGWVEYGGRFPARWIGAQTYCREDQADVEVWVDPRDPAALVNRQRYQWEWKNCLSHEHAGRSTDGNGPSWMNWNFLR